MMHWFLFLFVWVLLWPDVSSANDLPFFVQANLVTLTSAVLLCVTPELFDVKGIPGAFDAFTVTPPAIPRERKSVYQIFKEFGPTYVRRAYRMDETDFWRLCRILRPYMQIKKPVSKGRGARKKNGAKNGVIPSPTKISAAIRWFAGGSAYDIGSMHGISHTDVFRCIWRVVDAVNSCPELAFNFPENHDQQREIANGFARKSKAGF